MKRGTPAIVLVVTASVSVLTGYWLGVRDGWETAPVADFVPRAVVATQQLRWLRTGKSEMVITRLESEVDLALISADDVLKHPMRELWAPVWGISVYRDYEKYLTYLANYRKERPSSTATSQDLKDMVERYATKKER